MARRQQVGARELKTRLGHYIGAVRRGATIVVTERGEPVAEIRPIARRASLDAKLDRLADAGVITRGTGEPLPPIKPIRISGPKVSSAIIEDREDRF